jgi:hypothetical protein
VHVVPEPPLPPVPPRPPPGAAGQEVPGDWKHAPAVEQHQTEPLTATPQLPTQSRLALHVATHVPFEPLLPPPPELAPPLPSSPVEMNGPPSSLPASSPAGLTEDPQAVATASAAEIAKRVRVPFMCRDLRQPTASPYARFWMGNGLILGREVCHAVTVLR